jgi:integrase
MKTPKVSLKKPQSILITFTLDGKQIKVHPGGNFFNQVDLNLANAIAHQIGADLLSGNYDVTRKKYKIKNPKKFDETEIGYSASLHMLLDEYLRIKKSDLSPVTFSQYQLYAKAIKKYGDVPTKDVLKVCEKMNSEYTFETYKKRITFLKSAFHYFYRRELIQENPLTKLEVKKRKKKKEIESFTEQERDLIIERAKEKWGEYSVYTNLIEFLFFTGCRPSEALGIEWIHIFDKQIKLCQVWNQNMIIDSLKTQDSRRIILSNRAYGAVLRQRDWNSKTFLFEGKAGKPIDWIHFSNRLWPLLFDEKMRKLTAYSMRHTFITLCLDKKTNIQDVAAYVGNSSRIIYDHYASANRNFVPEV